MKQNNLLFAMILAISTTVFSQKIQVSGTVKDTDAVLPGVNIVVKNTRIGTTTDFNGKYTISATKGSILVFSFLGYTTQEIQVTESKINVTMVQEVNQLEEVVVATAYGIKQNEKELPYAVTQVKTDDLNLTGVGDAMSALQGRVAGLQIRQSSGSAGGGIDILIRGMSSMDPNQNNQPLIVIDGVSVNNDTFTGEILPTAGTNATGSNEQYSFASRISDLNPEDIETYNILKGAAATALYGARAANGAIIITTKSGKKGKAKIKLSYTTTINKVTKTPELQKVFREGLRGRPYRTYTPDEVGGYTPTGIGASSGPYNWGVRYSEDSFTYNGTTVDLSNDRFYDPYEVFRTGIRQGADFNISGANDQFNYYFSLGNSSTDPIVHNTSFDRTTVSFRGGMKVNDKLKIGSSIYYSNTSAIKPTGGDKSMMSAFGYWSPTFPINDYLNPDGSQRNAFPGWIDNPRFNTYISSLTENTNRWIGSANINWSPKEWIHVNYTGKIDNYTTFLNRFVPPELDAGSQVNGFIVDQNYNYYGLESNLLVTLKKDITKKISSSLLLGNSIVDNKRTSYRMYGQNLNLPHFNHMSNAQENFIISNYVSQKRLVGFFSELKLNYDNMLFLTISGRNDFDSTLPLENNSYFYPSAGLSFDFHRFIGNKTILSFGKIRATYAEVGNGTTFGQVGNYFFPDANFPWGGTGGYISDRYISANDLKPERTKSKEFGLDFRFLRNRIRIDYAYFNSTVHSAIFSVKSPPSSGVLSIRRNAGIYETNGHELLISGDIIKTNDLTWGVSVNYDTNDGKIKELPDDVPFLNFVDDYSGARIYLQPKEGDRIGTLYGFKYNRVDGKLLIGANGLPTTNFNEKEVVGNVMPDFTMSFGNNVKWKNFNFNFLLEWKKGGDKYSWQRYILNRMGQSQYTMQYRENDTYRFDGVMEDPANPGTYIPNTIDADFSPTSSLGYLMFNSNSYARRNSEVLLQDASWVKLRNIGVSYSLNANLLKNFHVDNVDLSANVSNILLWTPFDGFDPEGSDYSAGSNKYGFTGRSIPLTENYSFGIKVGF